jgi:hypothetical protein
MYHLIKTFNHNLNILGANSPESRLVKIEGVDIDAKEGSISLVAAFDAFDKTRNLLSEEIINLAKLAESHEHALENLKANANTLSGKIGDQICSYIDEKIEPVIEKAKDASYLLQKELKQLPVASRDEEGKLIFVDGKMKMDNDPKDLP